MTCDSHKQGSESSHETLPWEQEYRWAGQAGERPTGARSSKRTPRYFEMLNNEGRVGRRTSSAPRCSIGMPLMPSRHSQSTAEDPNATKKGTPQSLAARAFRYVPILFATSPALCTAPRRHCARARRRNVKKCRSDFAVMEDTRDPTTISTLRGLPV